MMAIVEVLAWVATATVLLTYIKGGRWFDWANAIGCIPIGTVAYLHGNYTGVIISAFFGLIGVYRLWKD